MNRRKLTLKDYSENKDARLDENAKYRKQRKKNITLRLYTTVLFFCVTVYVQMKRATKRSTTEGAFMHFAIARLAANPQTISRSKNVTPQFS